MRAAVCTRYGRPEVLQLREVEKPIPRDNEVLIKIYATTVTSSDWFIRSALRSAPVTTQILLRLVMGFTRPRKPILGLVLAGEIEETGKRLRRFRVGDRVYAFTKFRFGSYAQYTSLPETATLASAPSNLTYEEAAAIPYGGLLALHYLRKGTIRAGQQVLIYGASGAVGTSAVQLAKHFGTVVTAVCSTTNLDLVASLGADAVIDYTKQHIPGKVYDLVLDAVGTRKTSRLKAACGTALTPDGKYISVDDGMPHMTASDLEQLTDLVEAGKIKPVIDRCYPLEQIVAAHQYVEQGHKKGNVVVSVSHEST
jgi:NADPH:quinone reductase-like Zn-dependent oxidoreductase